jgi:hypothetical protein
VIARVSPSSWYRLIYVVSICLFICPSFFFFAAVKFQELVLKIQIVHGMFLHLTRITFLQVTL